MFLFSFKRNMKLVHGQVSQSRLQMVNLRINIKWYTFLENGVTNLSYLADAGTPEFQTLACQSWFCNIIWWPTTLKQGYSSLIFALMIRKVIRIEWTAKAMQKSCKKVISKVLLWNLCTSKYYRLLVNLGISIFSSEMAKARGQTNKPKPDLVVKLMRESGHVILGKLPLKRMRMYVHAFYLHTELFFHICVMFLG